MKKATKHTAFVEITSHGSGGRGRIIKGHKAIRDDEKFTDPYLTSSKFKKFPVGTHVIVIVKLVGSKRYTQTAFTDPKINDVFDFSKKYRDQMIEESRIYDEAYKLKKVDIKWADTSLTPPFTVGKPVGKEKPEKVSSAKLKEAHQIDKNDESVASEWADKIYIKPKDRKVFEVVKKLSNNKHQNVMMVGPSGYGKSSVPEQLAKEWGMEFLRWDCATVRDPEEFFGYRGAQDGSTLTEDGDNIFTKSLFTQKITDGNCVIVLDELNRIDPYISNILFPMLDHAGKTVVAGYEIEIGPNVIFVATVNLGYQFTGTFALDTALVNRFGIKILVGPLPRDIEKKILIGRGNIDEIIANNILAKFDKLRKMNELGTLSVDASTRVSIQIAELVGNGLDMREAFIYVIVNSLDKDEAKEVADVLSLS